MKKWADITQEERELPITVTLTLEQAMLLYAGLTCMWLQQEDARLWPTGDVIRRAIKEQQADFYKACYPEAPTQAQ